MSPGHSTVNLFELIILLGKVRGEKIEILWLIYCTFVERHGNFELQQVSRAILSCHVQEIVENFKFQAFKFPLCSTHLFSCSFIIIYDAFQKFPYFFFEKLFRKIHKKNYFIVIYFAAIKIVINGYCFSEKVYFSHQKLTPHLLEKNYQFLEIRNDSREKYIKNGNFSGSNLHFSVTEKDVIMNSSETIF